MGHRRLVALACLACACGGDERGRAPDPAPPRDAAPPVAEPHLADAAAGPPAPRVLSQGQMRELAFHADAGGRLSLIALSWDGVLSGNTAADRALNELQVWNLDTGRARSSDVEHPITAMAVARTADLVATVDLDDTVALRSLATLGAPRWTRRIDDADMVAITGDGARVLVSDERGTVYLLDGATGRVRWKRRLLSTVVMALALSPDGRVFAIGGDARDVVVAAVRDGEVVARLRHRAPTNDLFGGVFALAFSPDGRALATSGGDDVVRVFTIPGGRLALSVAIQTPMALAWSPDGRWLVWAHTTIEIRRSDDGAIVGRLEGHTSDVRTLAFSPDGRMLASGGRDKTIRIWDLSGLSPTP